MHRLSTSFVLGYHGCDRKVAEELLSGAPFKASDNDYDWLGCGVYFWEANPARGLQFAAELNRRPRGKSAIAEPYVVGAVIDLGFCLDLLSSAGIEAVSAAYDDFAAYCQAASRPMPQNTGGADTLLRRLDCAVINHLHQVRFDGALSAFDTIRGVFLEGGEAYPGSGFSKKTHLQICVRNLSCIKGVFRVPDDQLASA